MGSPFLIFVNLSIVAICCVFTILPVLLFQATLTPCLPTDPANEMHLNFYLYISTSTDHKARAPHQASLSVPDHSCRICVRHAMVPCLAGELLQWQRASLGLLLSRPGHKSCT